MCPVTIQKTFRGNQSLVEASATDLATLSFPYGHTQSKKYNLEVSYSKVTPAVRKVSIMSSPLPVAANALIKDTLDVSFACVVIPPRQIASDNAFSYLHRNLKNLRESRITQRTTPVEKGHSHDSHVTATRANGATLLESNTDTTVGTGSQHGIKRSGRCSYYRD
jgi:hypothetical protein